MNQTRQGSKLGKGFSKLVLALSFVASFGIITVAQAPQLDPAVTAAVKPEKASDKPGSASTLAKRFRDARIGMTADELTDLWGEPKVADSSGYIYEPSEDQMAQVWIDADKKVRAVAITFNDGAGAPPTIDVFGPDSTISPSADGSIYHMQRYPELGYWVSYHKGAGEKAAVTLTLHKL